MSTWTWLLYAAWVVKSWGLAWVLGSGVCGLVAFLALAQTEPAAEHHDTTEVTPRFGLEGETMLALDAGLAASTFSASEALVRSAGIAADLDYFVARDLSLGFEVTLSYSRRHIYGADGSLV